LEIERIETNTIFLQIKDERVKFTREINSSGEPILTVSSEFVSLLTSSITISADEIDCDGGEVR